MLTAKEQTLFNNAKLLAETIRNTKHDGRHDGLGNPILAVGMYLKWAHEACDGVEWLLSQVDHLTTALERIAGGECEVNHPPEMCNCASKIATQALLGVTE